MMYDYNSIKSFWSKFFKDWQEDAKSYQEQVTEFWKDFFKQKYLLISSTTLLLSNSNLNNGVADEQ